MKRIIENTIGRFGWTKEDWKKELIELFCLGSIFAAGFILPGLIG